MHDDAERNVAAGSKADRKNDPFSHHVTISHASWKATGEAATVSPIEDRSVTPPVSWLTQCPLL
jgi:hypothetical protein